MEEPRKAVKSDCGMTSATHDELRARILEAALGVSRAVLVGREATMGILAEYNIPICYQEEQEPNTNNLS